MTIDLSIFRTSNIRGKYPEQLNNELSYKIGFALTRFLKGKAFAVGRDMRVSSNSLFDSLAQGINDGGVDVIDLGLCSTDGLYFSVGKFGFDGGVMITANHYPKEYNGFKICRKNAEPISGQEGLNNITAFIESEQPIQKSPVPGNIIRKDIAEEYANHCLSFIDKSKIKKFKIVIDAGNGMAGATLPPVLAQLPIQFTKLFFELDGSFPNHPASPSELENLVDLQQTIAEQSADFGVAFDGDADRMFLLDKHGRQIGGDLTTALIAKSLLTKQPGETIIYDQICSRAVPELVEKSGGHAIRSRTGHPLIKSLMKKHNAIFGGGHSGHFYFRENWFANSGLIAFLISLELLSIENRSLHDIVKEINPYVRSGEINSRVNSVSIKEKLTQVANAFNGGQQDNLDGLTISYPDFWFNLRPSSSKSHLRLNIEANSNEILERQKELLTKIIRS